MNLQRCLNKEYEYIKKSLIKYPEVFCIIVLIVIASIILPVAGYICGIRPKECSENASIILLEVGISLFATIFCLYLIPLHIRLYLNCMYPRTASLPPMYI